jgi:predicted nucleotidyltransferase
VIFAAVSGSHLFGFPSPDSDYDVRGCFAAPTLEFHGLRSPAETIERSTNTPKRSDDGGLDLVLHEARKFFNLLMRNGNAIEQIHSPLVLETSPAHDELRRISLRCITRHHVAHYFGFADQQEVFFTRRKAMEVKPLLYVFRILMSGCWLLRTGEVQSDVRTLNDERKLPFIDDLIARKLTGGERAMLGENHLGYYLEAADSLRRELHDLAGEKNLPDEAAGRDDLEALLLQIRKDNL